VFVVRVIGEEEMLRLQFGGACLEEFVPVIVLLVLGLEPGLDELAAVVLVGEELGVAEVGVLGDEGLLLDVLGFASSHKIYLLYFITQLDHPHSSSTVIKSKRPEGLEEMVEIKNGVSGT
jgi:hypothetical protein